MMESDKQRILKIISNWDKLQKEIEIRNITRDDLLNDGFVQWAVTTPLFNIGEHVNNLSKEFTDEHKDVPWSKIAGLRHRLVHNYDGTNWNIIVEVIFHDIPEFIEKLEDIIRNNEI